MFVSEPPHDLQVTGEVIGKLEMILLSHPDRPPQPSELSAQTLPQSFTLGNILAPKPHAALELSCLPGPCILRSSPLTYHPALTHHS